MECIRIEYKDGLGLFQYRDNYDENNRVVPCTVRNWPVLSNRHSKFNSPQEDNLDIRKDNKLWYCAYKSIEQMQEWITPRELKDIISNRGYGTSYRENLQNYLDYLEEL